MIRAARKVAGGTLQMTTENVPRSLINRTTPHYVAAMAAGFTFGEPMILRDHSFLFAPGTALVKFPFSCVCGRQEVFQTSVQNGAWDHMFPMDVARELERLGSFSPDHLREDGYSEDDIKRIRWPFDMLDTARRYERMRRHMLLMAPEVVAAIECSSSILELR